MAASRTQQRMDTIPAIARLARSRDYRTAFEEILGSRQQTIITALPDDTLGYVLDLLDDAGGSAILAMATGGAVRIAALLPASQARLAVAVEDDRVAEVHRDSRVDMFFALLDQGGPLVVRQVAARLVDTGPLQLT